MSALPAKANFTILPGVRFQKTLQLFSGTPGSAARDLTDYSAQMPLHEIPGGVPDYILSTAAGTITLGGATGLITLSIPALVTIGFAAWHGGSYTLTVTDPTGEPDAILWGGLRIQTVGL